MDDDQIKNIEKRIFNLEKTLRDLIETLDKRSKGFEDLLDEFNDAIIGMIR
jgi:predicted ribonuclease toxin of YeeF-YezG toxin-antitoxin module